MLPWFSCSHGIFHPGNYVWSTGFKLLQQQAFQHPSPSTLCFGFVHTMVLSWQPTELAASQLTQTQPNKTLNDWKQAGRGHSLWDQWNREWRQEMQRWFMAAFQDCWGTKGTAGRQRKEWVDRTASQNQPSACMEYFTSKWVHLRFTWTKTTKMWVFYRFESGVFN